MRRRWHVDWRAETPWLLLLASALAAPLLVREQGGDWHSALAACFACLAAPSLGIEAMLALTRLMAWSVGPPTPRRSAGRQRER
jgi:hypothetical protein